MIRKLWAATLLGCICELATAQPVPLETGVVAGDVPIYYQIYGSEIAPPVLFIHPFGTHFDEARFEFLINFLADYKLIGFDVRGHGRSGKPAESGDYGLNLVADVDRLMDHLKLDDAHIIGASMGGIIGLKFASLHPGKVRSLTLLGQGLVPAENYQTWVQMGKAVVDATERSAEQEATLHIYSGLLTGYPPLLVTESEASLLNIPILIVIGEGDERLESARNLKKIYPATNLIVAPGFIHATILNEDSPFFLAIKGFMSKNEP